MLLGVYPRQACALDNRRMWLERCLTFPPRVARNDFGRESLGGRGARRWQSLAAAYLLRFPASQPNPDRWRGGRSPTFPRGIAPQTPCPT